MIAITGATGHLGGSVARQLADLDPRLVVRHPERAPRLPGCEVRRATYDDAAAMRAALDGVTTLLLVSASESADRRRQHCTAIQAAADAHVRHVVYTSFAGADPAATFTLGRDHADAEQAIRDSGMSWTFLRDNFYLDVLPHFADAEGVIRGPAGDGRVAAVARADVAEVAAAVIRDPNPHGAATYELTGPEALTLEEVAARAGRVLGRDLRFEDQSVPEAYASRRATYDVEDWQLDAWVSTYTAIRDGSVATLTDDVARVLGHPPRSPEQAWSSLAAGDR